MNGWSRRSLKALNPIAARSKSLSDFPAAYAKQHIKNHPPEAGGDNRGPWVRSYLGWHGKDARWCAGFVCFALEQAAFTLGVKTPSVFTPSDARGCAPPPREGTGVRCLATKMSGPSYFLRA
jgi:hypothetical protein